MVVNKDFFRIPTTADKLDLFQHLFDSGEIHADLGLALLKVVRAELGGGRTRDRSVYKRYTRTIQAVRYHKADMLQLIADAWNQGGLPENPEWLQDGKIR